MPVTQKYEGKPRQRKHPRTGTVKCDAECQFVLHVIFYVTKWK